MDKTIAYAAEQIQYAVRAAMVKDTRIVIGNYVGAEGVDPNLSKVQVGDVLMRFIPRVSSATPTAGQAVLLVGSKDTPMVIVGVVLGDITLASDGSSSPVEE